MATIYRGYDITEDAGNPGKFIVKKNGQLVASLLGSADAALAWIDKRKREERELGRE